MKKSLFALSTLATLLLISCGAQPSSTVNHNTGNNAGDNTGDNTGDPNENNVPGALSKEEWSAKIREADADSKCASYHSFHVKGPFKTTTSLNFETTLDRDFAFSITANKAITVFFPDEEQAVYDTYEARSDSNSEEATALFRQWYAAKLDLYRRGYLDETNIKYFTGYTEGNPTFVYDEETGHFSCHVTFNEKTSYFRYEWNEDLLLVNAESKNTVSDYKLSYSWSADKLENTTYNE